MKIKLNKTGIFLAASLLLTGCDMDRYPLTNFSEETFYSDAANVKLALTGLYRGNIEEGVNYGSPDWWAYPAIVLLDGVSDIGYDRRGFNNDLGKLTAGTIIDSNGWVTSLYKSAYKRIGACNRFMEGLDKIGSQNPEMIRMRAEARFIRATQYFYLGSYYHDVPLVKTVLTLDEANSVKKASRKEVLEYAATELADVATILPRHKDLPGAELGRATAQAALAFLVRIYMVMEEYGKAAQACKQIIDWGDNALESNYQELFYPSNRNNREFLFAVQFVDDLAGIGLPQHAFPVKDNGWCLVNATNHLFEAYNFTDGTMFSYDDEKFDSKNLGKNRDPRLDYTIFYDGSTFRGTTFNCNPETNASDKITYGQQTTQTGYMLRKFFDEGWSGDINAYGVALPVARYADILLLYLEAKLQNGEAITQSLLDETINLVRGRQSVNMPAITETNPDKLMEIIQNERMVELAFEGWRLWDLFRWGIAKEKLNEDIYGAPFYGLSNPDLIRKKDGQADPWNRWYVNARSFEDGQDVWPIPLSEKNINPNLR